MAKKFKFIIFFFCLFLIFFFYKRFNHYKSICIAIVFGTRPEAIKMLPIIKELKKNRKFLCVIINTGQHSKLIKQILKSLNISNSIDINLNIMRKNQTLSKLTYLTILKLDKIYSSINPDAVIVQGDTSTSFSAALSAFYHKIPVFHVEAGLRTHNLYSPFPEEFNRIGIDDISTLLFATTETAAINLIKENKNLKNIFITGNTVVDSLFLTIKNTYPSKYISWILKTAYSRCNSIKENCKILLLTCHRRENYFSPIVNIIKAVQALLKNFKDIVIILPFHLNPNVIQSIKMGLPKIVYNEIINGKEIKNKYYSFFNRFLLIQPLNYIDLIHLQSKSFFIMTDSGGIQEEGISIGKPVLILRENTERPEGIKSGSAILTGTSTEKIYKCASLLLLNQTFYNKIAQPHNIYGFGNSSKIIVNIIERYFDNELPDINFNLTNKSEKFDNFNFISQIDYSLSTSIQYELVVVLTVWKRNNLEKQLMQVKRQSIIEKKKTNIIVFQNFNHTDIKDIIEKWKKPDVFNENVKLTFIKSPIETGYFGRFITPLTTSVTSNAYFIICDDDVIWGDRYFENMIRVVDEGFLATRNGRLLDKNYKEFFPASEFVFKEKVQVCFNEDIEYDFGGHIWAGKISWLKKVWRHIPVSIENCEDFWLSAVLKSYYRISTKTPKCPCHKGEVIIPDLCAASDKSAIVHDYSKLGNSLVNDFPVREAVIKQTAATFNYKPLIFSNPNIADDINSKYIYGNETHPLFNLIDPLWNDVLFWQ